MSKIKCVVGHFGGLEKLLKDSEHWSEVSVLKRIETHLNVCRNVLKSKMNPLKKLFIKFHFSYRSINISNNPRVGTN